VPAATVHALTARSITTNHHVDATPDLTSAAAVAVAAHATTRPMVAATTGGLATGVVSLLSTTRPRIESQTAANTR